MLKFSIARCLPYWVYQCRILFRADIFSTTINCKLRPSFYFGMIERFTVLCRRIRSRAVFEFAFWNQSISYHADVCTEQRKLRRKQLFLHPFWRQWKVRDRVSNVRVIPQLWHLDDIPVGIHSTRTEYKNKTKALGWKVRLTINCYLDVRRALILLNALRPDAGLSDALSDGISRDRSLVRRVRKPSKKRQKPPGNFLRRWGKQRHGGKSVVWISLETFLGKRKVFTPRDRIKRPCLGTIRRSRINEFTWPDIEPRRHYGALCSSCALNSLFRADNTVTFITSW